MAKKKRDPILISAIVVFVASLLILLAVALLIANLGNPTAATPAATQTVD